MDGQQHDYRIFDGDAASWNRLVTAGDDASLLQTWEWGEAKAATGPWQVERGVVVGRGEVIGAAQTLIRKTPLPGSGMAWISRGPIAPAREYGGCLEALARRFCNESRHYLRIQPALGEDEFQLPAGLNRTTTAGWASAVVDLREPEDVLRKNLHRKWRNHLSRAERSNLELSVGSDESTFGTFMDGHAAHLARLGPKGGLDPALLNALQERLAPERKLLCFIARKDGAYLGGGAIARFGTTGEYLAGHNTEAGRAEKAGQLLLWSAMLHLKADGYTRLDLGGMDEHLTTPGIFEFKQRIGGRPYRLANELEGGTGRAVNKLIRWRVERERRAIATGGES